MFYYIAPFHSLEGTMINLTYFLDEDKLLVQKRNLLYVKVMSANK